MGSQHGVISYDVLSSNTACIIFFYLVGALGPTSEYFSYTTASTIMVGEMRGNHDYSQVAADLSLSCPERKISMNWA